MWSDIGSHGAEGEPARAAAAYARAAELTYGDAPFLNRVALLTQLARAEAGAGATDRAVVTLRSALDVLARAAELDGESVESGVLVERANALEEQATSLNELDVAAAARELAVVAPRVRFAEHLMSRATERLTGILGSLAYFGTQRCLRQIARHRSSFARLDDASLVEACTVLVSGPKVELHKPEHFFAYLLGVRLTERDAEGVALAAEAFSRFPPGDPARHPALHEQIQAAVHLLRGAIVQMDTGEGKTFALPTAASRSCASTRACTSSPRTPISPPATHGPAQPHWSALGIPVGVGCRAEYRGAGPGAWGADVVYTTLATLVFRSLAEEIGELDYGSRIA